MTMIIPPFGTDHISVVFSPSEPGVHNGTITFTSNSANSPHTIHLRGVSVADVPPTPSAISYLTASGAKLMDESNNQVMLRSINWYGFEQIGVPGGAWTRPFRTKTVNGVVREGMLDEIRRLGFNSIRLLVSEDVTWSGYKPETAFGFWNSTYISAVDNPEFLNSTIQQNPQDVKTSIEIMDLFVEWCEELGLRIIFDLHCLAPDDSNIYGTNGKWYTTSTPNGVGSSSGTKREPRNEQQAIDALVFLANRYKNRPIVAGFDLINEPHNCTWDRDPLTGVVGFYERCGNAIHAVNPNVLIVCEGVAEMGMNNGTVNHAPIGYENSQESLDGQYNWGVVWSGKLDEVARINTMMVTLTVPNKVVYSPHEYGSYPSTNGAPAAHQWFYPEQIANYPGPQFPDNMPSVWSRQWGYLAEQDIAPVWIGEFGSYLRIGGDPFGDGAGYNAQHLSYDKAWLAKLAEYCEANSIGYAFWAWNSGGDPDGLVGQQPAGTWTSSQQFKLNELVPFLPEVAYVPNMLPVTIQGNQFIRNNTVFRLKSVSWFGAETESAVPNAMWARNWKSMIAEIASMGFNSIRLPFSTQAFSNENTLPNDQLGLSYLNPDLVGKTVYQIFDMIIAECAKNNLYVILDHHRNSWDAQDGTPIRTGYTEANWHALWGKMAERYKTNTCVIGVDIYNEPYATAWNQWATWVESCANHIHTIAPQWIIFVQGALVADDPSEYFWAGGNLEGVRTRPIVLNLPNKIAYSPHEYAHSVYSAAWLARDGHAAPANWPLNLYALRTHHYGFIFEEGIAPIWVGEFGGQFGYTGTGTFNNTIDSQHERTWLTTMINHMNGDFDGDGVSDIVAPNMGMSFCYWSYNANSEGTGGLLTDDWTTHQTGKISLLAPLMNFTGAQVAPPPVDGPDITLPANAVGIVTIGDSITYNGTFENTTWCSQTCFKYNQTHRYRGTYAVVGSTSSQSLNLQLPSVLAMDPPPKACVVATGTNNISQGSQVFADVQSICAILIQNNIYPILWTVPPRNDITFHDTQITDYNQTIRSYATASGLALVDSYSVVVESTSPKIKADYVDPDGVHLTTYAYSKLSDWIVQNDIFGAIPSDGELDTTPNGNLITNGTFVDSNSDGIADNLLIAAGFVGSISTDSNGGRWQRITRPGTLTSANTASNFDMITVTPGQRYSLASKIRWDTSGYRSTIEGKSWLNVMYVMFTDATWKYYPTGFYVILGQNGDSAQSGTILRDDLLAPVGATRALIAIFVLDASVNTKPTSTYIEYSEISLIAGSHPLSASLPSASIYALLDSDNAEILDSSNNPLES